MKRLRFAVLILPVLIFFIGCEKNNNPKEVSGEEIKSKMFLQKSGDVVPVSDQSPFEIHSAGLYKGVLYMSVSFTGGDKPHEFTVSWDGMLKSVGDNKVMELIVYHSTASDQGTEMVFDSVSANITDLGVTSEVLNDTSLWIRVVNSTNIENKFFFRITNAYIDPIEYIDPVTVIHSRNVKVIKEGCGKYGIWGDLWLISNDSEPVSHYFVTEIDNSVLYTPAENDLLRIEFNYSFITDSSTVCPQLNLLQAVPVKIKALTKQ